MKLVFEFDTPYVKDVGTLKQIAANMLFDLYEDMHDEGMLVVYTDTQILDRDAKAHVSWRIE